jgi:hypothetical protein
MDYNIPNNNKILPFFICSAMLFYLFIIINVDIQASLSVPQLILRVLKLTIM